MEKEQIEQEKKKIVNQAKNDPFLAKIILQNNMNDGEIFLKYIDLIDIKMRSLEPEKYITEIEIKRNEKGELVTEYFYANNNKARDYLIKNNIFFSNLGGVKYKKFFTEINVDENNFFDLYKYQEKFKSKIFDQKFLDTLKGIFLHSNNEANKERLLSSIANNLAYANKKVAYVNIFYLIFEVKKTFGSAKLTEEFFYIEELIDIDVLILDGIGSDWLPMWFLPSLIKILDFRERKNKLTYFGSEIPLNDIEKNIDNPKKDLYALKRINRLKKIINSLIECEVWIE
ncbi:hypothetical protein [Mycoplasmopsis cricetuli]|uniref:hypothetical protein n=1 Tax=Mycoplasmopsis cricetuli TaxID=171283 RepID=UPI00046FC1D4|nr:hypothetical protein [Mycoplasmopsis cricetuli]